MNIQKTENFNFILSTIQTSKQKAYAQVNATLVELYWNIGKYISIKVKEKSWGKGVVKELADYIKVQDPTIKGFSDKKLATLWRLLPWSHNKRIMSLKTPQERTILGNETLSDVMKELPQDTANIFRDSYALEFLDLPTKYKEKDLQKALIGSLKDFILELGIGFAFMGEEYKLEVGNDNFKIDLLFYHRYLNCLVAFELKIGKFKPSIFMMSKI